MAKFHIIAESLKINCQLPVKALLMGVLLRRKYCSSYAFFSDPERAILSVGVASKMKHSLGLYHMFKMMLHDSALANSK
jgi:hypothetical protein